MRKRVVAAILTASPTTALLPWAGTTRLRSVAQAICAASCERVAVVLGPAAGSVTSSLTGLPVASLPNVLWSEGSAASMRCAVAWALRTGADGLLLVHGDQARLDRAHVESLLQAFRTSRATVASYVSGDVTLPAVFGVESYAKLGQLTGERDARDVLRLTPVVKAIPWPEGAIESAIDRAIDQALDAMVANALDVTAIPAVIPEIHEASEPVTSAYGRP